MLLFVLACYFYVTQHILFHSSYAMAEQDGYVNSRSCKFSTRFLRSRSRSEFLNWFHS
jgi:hypothetical protein